MTTESLLKNKKVASKLETYETRKRNLQEFIKTIADINRAQIIELNDIYGPPINEPEYDGLVVSQETYKVGVKINEIRESKGLTPLIIIVIPIIKDENNQKISSTSIREEILKK